MNLPLQFNAGVVVPSVSWLGRNCSPQPHITLFAHQQNRRCAGESGSPCEGTVEKAAMQPPRFWPKQAAALALFNKGACDTETNVVVLVRGVVAVPGRRRQVVGVVVPAAATDPTIRRTHDPDSPPYCQRLNTARRRLTLCACLT